MQTTDVQSSALTSRGASALCLLPGSEGLSQPCSGQGDGLDLLPRWPLIIALGRKQSWDREFRAEARAASTSEVKPPGRAGSPRPGRMDAVAPGRAHPVSRLWMPSGEGAAPPWGLRAGCWRGEHGPGGSDRAVGARGRAAIAGNLRRGGSKGDEDEYDAGRGEPKDGGDELENGIGQRWMSPGKGAGMEATAANPGGRRPTTMPPTLTHRRRHTALSPHGTDPTAPRCFPFGGCPESVFLRAGTSPAPSHSPFPSLCQHPPPAPGTALRSCPLAPDPTGDIGGHPSPTGARRDLGAIVRAPRGSQLCLRRGNGAGGSLHPHPRCAAAAGGQLVVVAFKMV